MNQSDDTQNELPQKRTMHQRLWGDVRNEQTNVQHDEICEYDNPIPDWWKGILAATALFAFPYLAYYHGTAQGRTSAELLSSAQSTNARLRFAEIGTLDSDAQTLVKYANDKTWMAVGKSIFQNNCAACHARDGGGQIGPNLCDEQYKNVSQIGDIYKVVSNGAAAGAMPAWKNRLEQNELVLVSSYAASLRGTTPATAKGPDGREIPAWPEYVDPPRDDTTDTAP